MNNLSLLRILVIAFMSVFIGRGNAIAQGVEAMQSRVDGFYYRVTSVNDLVAGERYLIAAALYNTVISKTQNENNRSAIGVTKIADAIRVRYKEAKYCEFILGGTPGAWTLQDANTKNYLCSSSSSSNHLKSKPTVDDNARASISINEGNATILFQGDKTRNLLQYNKSNNIFSCYASINSQQPIQLYKLHTAITIGADGYDTFYSTKAFVMPDGVVGGIVTAATDGVLSINYRYHAGNVVPANTGLLVMGAPGTYPYVISNSTVAAPSVNMLYGVNGLNYAEETSVSGKNVRYYVLSHDPLGANVGFYWGADNGAAISWQPSKAFLAIDFGSGSKVCSVFRLVDSVTGIGTPYINKVQANSIHTLSGVNVGTKIEALPKGFYIVNGRKIVR